MPGVVFEPAQPLGPDRAIGPDVDLLDRSQHPGANDLDARAEPAFGRALVAHLGAQLLLGRERPHQPGFLDRPRQRLLTEAVLAHAHGHDAGRGVRVVRSAHSDGVDLVVEILEHLPIIIILLGFGVLGPHLVEGMGIDVAKPDDLAVAACVVGVAVAFAAHADAGEANLLVGRARRGAGKGRCAASKN